MGHSYNFVFSLHAMVDSVYIRRYNELGEPPGRNHLSVSKFVIAYKNINFKLGHAIQSTSTA